MKWLKQFFNKSKKMNWKEKSLEEIQEFFQTKDFQWLKGDQMGNIEKFKAIEKDESTGFTFICFRSGGRMNVDLVQEYMDVFPSQNIDFASLASASPPQPKQPIGEKSTAVKSKTNTVSSIQLSESPIYSLLKKQKNNWVNVNITLKLNLPSKNLYGVLTSSFEDADTEIINFVTEGVDIDDIKAALGESILSYYDKKKNLVSSDKFLDQIEDGK
jgi:hypothetical protein